MNYIPVVVIGKPMGYCATGAACKYLPASHSFLYGLMGLLACLTIIGGLYTAMLAYKLNNVRRQKTWIKA